MATLKSKRAEGGNLSCNTVGISILENSIWLEGFLLNQKGDVQPNSYQASSGAIRAKGINWWRLYFHKEIHLEEFSINQPNIVLAGQPFNQEQSDSSTQGLTLIIDKLVIEGGRLEYVDAADSTRVLLQVDSLQVQMKDIVFRNDKSADNFTFQDMDLSIQQLSHLTPNGLYHVKSGPVVLQKMNKTARISNLQIEPRLSRQRFAESAGKQKAQLELSIKTVTLQDIDLPGLLLDKRFDCQSILVDSFQLKAYKDKNYPENKADKLLPQQALMQLDWPLQVDKIQVRNGFVKYTELGPGKDKPGEVFFEDIYATFYNVTNKKSLLEQQAIQVDTRSRFMGTGDLNIQFQFDPLNPNYSYTYKGSFGTFAFENINQMLTPRMSVSMESGKVKQMNFQVEATNKLSTGVMDLEYENLKIRLIDSETKEERNLLGTISNSLLQKENLPAQEDYRQGQIRFERLPHKSIFNDLWKAIFSGIQSTVLPDILLNDKLEANLTKQ